MMATRSEARQTRKELRRHSRRIQDLIERCIAQVSDGDVKHEDRVSAEQSLKLLFDEQQNAARLLERVEDALDSEKPRTRRG